MMASSPRISVVIITYNFEKYLKDCIESVLVQTLRPFEIIICDDHSTDGSWAIIEKYSEQYPGLIRAYRHEKNMGPFYNGTFGANLFRGDLISLMDGDDRWLPEKLELEAEAFDRQPGAQIAYSNVITIDAEGRRIGVWHDNGPPPPSGDVFIKVFSRCFFSNSRSVFRNELVSRKAFDAEGHCDESLESFWDWDRKLRLTERFSVAYSGKALVEYREHGGGFSKHDDARHVRAMAAVYQKNLPLLDRRPMKEAALARWHAECLLAKGQMGLPSSEQNSVFSVDRVLERNWSVLEKLPRSDRTALKKELSELLGELYLRAGWDSMEKGYRRTALGHWLNSLRYGSKALDYLLPMKIIIPSRVYSPLKWLYRQMFG
jgi:glycosyltransferase involved in cell wall biosynthesis